MYECGTILLTLAYQQNSDVLCCTQNKAGWVPLFLLTSARQLMGVGVAGLWLYVAVCRLNKALQTAMVYYEYTYGWMDMV